MNSKTLPLVIVPYLLIVVAIPLADAQQRETETGGGSAASTLPPIPGITAQDPFPQGCVDCHVKRPEMDVRLSTLMQQWHEVGVPPDLLARIKRFVPEGGALKGQHPKVDDAAQDIPATCIECHSETSEGPPLGPMMHGLHLTGGAQNHFLTEFEGQCTHCHKLDKDTGIWLLPSAPEY